MMKMNREEMVNKAKNAAGKAGNVAGSAAKKAGNWAKANPKAAAVVGGGVVGMSMAASLPLVGGALLVQLAGAAVGASVVKNLVS